MKEKLLVAAQYTSAILAATMAFMVVIISVVFIAAAGPGTPDARSGARATALILTYGAMLLVSLAFAGFSTRQRLGWLAFLILLILPLLISPGSIIYG